MKISIWVNFEDVPRVNYMDEQNEQHTDQSWIDFRLTPTKKVPNVAYVNCIISMDTFYLIKQNNEISELHKMFE